MLPSQFLALETQEKAFVCAAIDIKLKHDKEEKKKIESKSKRKH